MRTVQRLGAITLVGGLTGCVVAPLPPQQIPLVAVPGPAKTDVVFRQDDLACRAAAVELPPDAPAPARPAPTAQGTTSPAAAVSSPDALPPMPPAVIYLRCMENRGNIVQPMAPAYASGPPVVYGYYPGYPVYAGFGDTYPWLYGDSFGFYRGGWVGGWGGGWRGGWGGGWRGGWRR